MFNCKKIHLIGAKGVGMTMLAQYLAAQGSVLTGSDVEEKFMTDEVLAKAGVKLNVGFSADNIPKDADLIIYSTAYSRENNKELAAAMNGKTKTIAYAEALAGVFNQKYGLAVCGSHGKTTTTAWLGFVLDRAGLKPTALVGARVPQFGGSALIGESDYFIAETDEYQNKLAHFNPKAVLLNNIDFDHPDFFKNEEEYKKVFSDFINKIPNKGFLVANFDDPIVKEIALKARAKIVSYALEADADYQASDIKEGDKEQFFRVLMKTEEGRSDLGIFTIKLSGAHNIRNALAVITASLELGADLLAVRRGLAEFAGSSRRMEVLGQYRGATIIDDYAHHPTEIKAVLEGVKSFYGQARLIAVFHPHTFTRTKALFGDFAKSFSLADEVIVLDIYGSAREAQGGVHSRELVEEIKKQEKGKKVSYLPDIFACEKYLRPELKKGDILLLIGAGDVFRLGESLLGKN